MQLAGMFAALEANMLCPSMQQANHAKCACEHVSTQPLLRRLTWSRPAMFATACTHEKVAVHMPGQYHNCRHQ
jgi:hypothetical protein